MRAESPLSPIVGVLLAGGFARRFGRQKLLEPFGADASVAGLSCRKLVAATDRVIAVVRPEELALSEHLSREGAQVFVCADASLGMGVTLARGVAASKDAAAWLVALADMPAIEGATLNALVAALRLGQSLVMPCHRGQRGHPVGFASRYYQQLIELKGDQGARSILRRHPAEWDLIEVDDPGVLLDIDVEGDLKVGIQLMNSRALDES